MWDKLSLTVRTRSCVLRAGFCQFDKIIGNQQSFPLKGTAAVQIVWKALCTAVSIERDVETPGFMERIQEPSIGVNLRPNGNPLRGETVELNLHIAHRKEA